MAGYLLIDGFTKVYLRDGIPIFVYWDADVLERCKLTLRDLQHKTKKHLQGCGWDVELTVPLFDEDDDEIWSSVQLKV